MSITDELTGLHNRLGFFAIAQQQLKVTKWVKGKLALVFADLDDLKTINDTWGHHKGDEALVAMADVLKRSFRESDLIARISGDDFALLLFNTHENNFDIIFGRLQQNIDAFNLRSEVTFFLSLSIVMALYDYSQPCSLEDLLKLADRRMYDQKQRKKNIFQA